MIRREITKALFLETDDGVTRLRLKGRYGMNDRLVTLTPDQLAVLLDAGAAALEQRRKEQ